MPVRKCGTFANRFFLLKLKVRLEAWRQRWQIAATLDSRDAVPGWPDANPEMTQSDRPKEKKTKCAMNASA